ncbi:hypothetical protein [Nocardia asiatica]|uniref:hypothetical protein n=1 Tax=Nocardia asiatica TaxID=209252 RepID=UPI002453F0FB|nr:hypothetical protein [Nocardia asiatica]
MSTRKRSFVTYWPTNASWQWAVIPATYPGIYIPTATRELAQTIADGLDSYVFRPIDFDYQPTTPAWLAAIGFTSAAA